MTHNSQKKLLTIFSLVSLALSIFSAPLTLLAGVFNLPYHPNPDHFGFGVEPELIMTDGGGVDVNFRYLRGLTELNHFTLILGIGAGPRGFRTGGAYNWDFYPSYHEQPGMGVAAQALFVELNPWGPRIEVTGIPYLHKLWKIQNVALDSFIAFPIGVSCLGPQVLGTGNLNVGSLFPLERNWQAVFELQIALVNSETVLSGGVIYSH